MKKEFLPYDRALKLKELGFNNSLCLGFWVLGEHVELSQYTIGDWNSHPSRVSAPTFRQAFEWFREKHELLSWVYMPFGVSNGYFHEIINLSSTPVEGGFSSGQSEQFQSYEGAELACIDKLINIVKTQPKK